MVRAWLIKMGIVWSTIAITAIACLSSVLLYLLLSFFFGGYSDIGVSRSIAIPLVIVPAAAFYVLKIIFQLHRSEAALADSEEKYRLLFNHAPSGIYEIDFIKGRLTNVNDVLCKYSGYSREELLTMSVFDFLAKESRDAFKERLEKLFKGEAVPDLVEYQIKTKPGTTLWVLLNARYTYENGIPVGATVIIHNIDEQKKQALEKARLEEALRQAHKMEALGTLAGGIAHDFNNILSAIMGYTEIARLGVPADAKVRTHLDKVMVACDRAKEMVRQILAFSRKSEFKKRPVRIAQVVKEAGELLAASLPSTIAIRMDINSESGFVGRGSYSDSSDYNESLHQCGIRHARKRRNSQHPSWRTYIWTKTMSRRIRKLVRGRFCILASLIRAAAFLPRSWTVSLTPIFPPNPKAKGPDSAFPSFMAWSRPIRDF